METKLANWCRVQRTSYKTNQLSDDKIDLLNAINFSWHIHSTNWLLHYKTLIFFRKNHQNLWPSGEKNNLARWCIKQRALFLSNKLPENRVMLLNKIGFPWEMNDWIQQYKYLVKFRELYPTRWPKAKEQFPDQNYIGSWCSKMRQDYIRGKLTQERKGMLDKIYFPWDHFLQNWQIQYNNLCKFRKTHPDHWPSQKINFPKGNKLGLWCSRQKRIYIKKKLDKDKERLLQKIGFPLKPCEDPWLKQYKFLILFRKIHPTRWPKAIETFPKGNNLGSWCDVQRGYFRNALLTTQKKKALDKLHFPWNPKIDKWMRQYNLLVNFRIKNPKRWPNRFEQLSLDKKLEQWCTNQRQYYKKGMLKKERIALLQKINFRLEELDTWTPQYHFLIKFKKKYPNRWPKAKEEFPQGIRLGSWCDKQRQKYKKGKLDNRKIALLTKIGFKWQEAHLLKIVDPLTE